MLAHDIQSKSLTESCKDNGTTVNDDTPTETQTQYAKGVPEVARNYRVHPKKLARDQGSMLREMGIWSTGFSIGGVSVYKSLLGKSARLKVKQKTFNFITYF